MNTPNLRDILPDVPHPAEPRSGLSARGVTVRKGGRVLLDDVTVHAPRGRVTALVGPNGAGKSTLLAAMSGDEAPDSGRVEFDGADLHGVPIRDRARLRAVLPQSHPATVPFTAGEVIEFGRSPWGEADPELRRRVIADCDVAHLLDRPVTVLSGGELARVHCARVLVQDTPVLLLDEPTAALDLRHAEAMLRLIGGRARDGVAVVVVLHDLAAAAAHADDVVVLDGGRVVAAGAPADTLTAELIGDVYGLAVEVLADSGGNPVIVPARGRHPTPTVTATPTEHPNHRHPRRGDMLRTTTERLTIRLREATAAVHDDAENSGFMTALLDGELTPGAVADLAGQLRFIYGALEDSVRAVADTPEGAAIADARLERHDALERDLAFLVGPRWRSSIEALPSTAAYVNRLTELGRNRDASALLAHHYVRYLGDLSGGQIIARRLRDHYGIDGDGARFYDFSAVGKIKPYRDAYRDRLDALGLDDEVRDRIVAEAVLAFRMNTALFRELNARHLPAGANAERGDSADADAHAVGDSPHRPHSA